MSEILGVFTEDQFKVLEPKQTSEPKPDETPKEGKGEAQPSDDVEEIPLKDKEQIAEDLKKAGAKSEEVNDGEKPDEGGYDIQDKKDAGEKPEDKGSGSGEEKNDGEPKEEGKEDGEPKEDGKETGEKKGEGKTDKQKKVDEQNAKDKERRERIKTKNEITEKINNYNTILVKHADTIPDKVKNSLESAISELSELRNTIKT